MTDISQQHGAFSWCELMTTDTAAAKEFYSQLFGWAIVERPMPGSSLAAKKPILAKGGSESLPPPPFPK